jgi:hypothetical protein
VKREGQGGGIANWKAEFRKRQTYTLKCMPGTGLYLEDQGHGPRPPHSRRRANAYDRDTIRLPCNPRITTRGWISAYINVSPHVGKHQALGWEIENS